MSKKITPSGKPSLPSLSSLRLPGDSLKSNNNSGRLPSFGNKTNTIGNKKRTPHITLPTVGSDSTIQSSIYPLFISIPIKLSFSNVCTHDDINCNDNDPEWDRFCILYKDYFTSAQAQLSSTNATGTENLTNNLTPLLNESTNFNPNTNNNNNKIIPPLEVNFIDPHNLHISLSRSQYLPGSERGTFLDSFSTFQLSRLRRLRSDPTLYWQKYEFKSIQYTIFVPISNQPKGNSNSQSDLLSIVTGETSSRCSTFDPTIISQFINNNDLKIVNDQNKKNNSSDQHHHHHQQQQQQQQRHEQKQQKQHELTDDTLTLIYPNIITTRCTTLKLLLNDTNDRLYHSFLLNSTNELNDYNSVSINNIYSSLIQHVDSFFTSIGKQPYYTSPIPHFSFGSSAHALTPYGQECLTTWQMHNANDIDINKPKSVTNSPADSTFTQQTSSATNPSTPQQPDKSIWQNDPNLPQSQKLKRLQEDWYSIKFTIDEISNKNSADEKLGDLIASMVAIKVKIGPDIYIFPLV